MGYPGAHAREQPSVRSSLKPHPLIVSADGGLPESWCPDLRVFSGFVPDTSAPPGGWDGAMDTMHLATQPRPRWFAGLRRTRPRILGGVAAGFAEFWAVDPLLIRVLVASPLLAAIFVLMAQTVLGLYGLGPVAGLLWLTAAATIAGYLLAWILIPTFDADSVVRRFLNLSGPVGALAKLMVGAVLLIVLGYVGLVALALLANLGAFSPLLLMFGMLVAVVGVAMLGVWLARGGDPRDALRRVGSPGLGRTDATTPPAWADPGSLDGEPTRVLATDDTVVGEGREATLSLPVPPHVSGEDTVELGSVDRARAAATVAADARAAAAEAARRERAAQRLVRRAERRERNRWGWLVAAVTLVTAGVLVLTDRSGVTSLGAGGIGVVALGLLTIGVLVGAWFGSARWLIAPALLLAGVLGTAAVAADAMDQAATAAPVTIAPTSLPADEQSSANWDEGTVTVDLTGTRALNSRVLDLSVGRGSLTVIIPADQWTEAYGEVALGVNNLNTGQLGVLRSGQQSLNSPVDAVLPRGAQPLNLYLRVGVGELTLIEQES